jgi:hypothetical protein
MIAQDICTIEPVLLELLAAKTIKLISRKDGIYVLTDRYSPKVCYSQKGDWKFEITAAAALLDTIEKSNFTSIRKVAEAFGRSRQWVFVYMEALASIGCIGMEGKHYKVLRTDNVRNVGKHIEPGILGRMRPKLSEEEKLRRGEETELRLQERLAVQASKQQIRKEKLIQQAWVEYRESEWFWRIKFETFLKRKGLE